MADYAHPETLVSTEGVADHASDPDVAVVEVNVDTTAYEQGHVPGSIGWNWQTQLCDTVRRDIIGKSELEDLLSSSGIGNDTTIVVYGDHNNWFAAWAFWQLKVYGHDDVRIMNGGRKKWIEEGRPLTTDVPSVEPKSYRASEADLSLRAFLPEVQATLARGNFALVDVRSADEFTGKILAPPGLPETCQRGGHIPGAKNIGWGMAVNEDGTFKSRDELAQIYGERGVTADRDVVTYCRIGERSSHSWFALKYLLGYPNVRNYDGSWTEWGNLVGAPIERGA
ncbi:MAG TPA: sulfurtransferase [Rhodothermales bacterium]|nr:sulfurtransferase [Rhodothermales bacterium]